VTDLFIVDAPHHTDEQIALFDEVLGRLALEIEISARALLAARLAPVPNAPPKIIRSLAFDDEIDVAGPVLAQSVRLDDPGLIQAAIEMGQEHLYAISQRRSLSEDVTDVLVERGDRVVAMSIVANSGARFSEAGFANLVRRSDGDDELAERVGARPDIPPRLFHRLLLKASHRVRAKLDAEYPKAKHAVWRAVGEATVRLRDEYLGGSGNEADDGAAERSVDHLDAEYIARLAAAGRSAEIATAIAVSCRVPRSFVESAMKEDRADTILVLARSAGLSWPAAKALLSMRHRSRGRLDADLARALAAFERLAPATARQIVEFYRRRRLGEFAGAD
jgi:uncharacterized protein (DUF2336 family)